MMQVQIMVAMYQPSYIELAVYTVLFYLPFKIFIKQHELLIHYQMMRPPSK